MRFLLALVLSAFFALNAMNAALAALPDYSGVFIIQGAYVTRTALWRGFGMVMGVLSVVFFLTVKFQDRLNVKMTRKNDAAIHEFTENQRKQARIDRMVGKGQQKQAAVRGSQNASKPRSRGAERRRTDRSFSSSKPRRTFGSNRGDKA